MEQSTQAADEQQGDGWSMRTKFLEEDGVHKIVRVVDEQELVDTLDYCKARHNEGLHGEKDFKLAATVPAVLIEDYCFRNGITFREFMHNREHTRRLLNDPALAGFRIWKGKV